MLSNIFLIAMAVLVALGVTARAAAVESDAVAVTELEDKTIDSFIMDNDAALIMFYAPWCGHCKALEPEFQQAAIAIKNENGAHKGVAFGKIDATKHTEAAKDFGIEGFPTLHFYKQRKAVHYTGGRTTDTIISWLTKRMGPTTRPLNTRIEVDEWMLPRGEGDTSAAEGGSLACSLCTLLLLPSSLVYSFLLTPPVLANSNAHGWVLFGVESWCHLLRGCVHGTRGGKLWAGDG